jgi:hypothetical protein
MLAIPEIEALRNGVNDSALVADALHKIRLYVNSLSTQTGINAQPSPSTVAPSLPTPLPPSGLTVTSSAKGVFTATITPNAANSGVVLYFLESSTAQDFSANVTSYPLGSALVASINLGNVTLYWRAKAKYQSSDYSPVVTFGSPATAVTGGLIVQAEISSQAVGSQQMQSLTYSNNSNQATVDSTDPGGGASIWSYAAGGTRGITPWVRSIGGNTESVPAGAAIGASYVTSYYVVYDPSIAGYRNRTFYPSILTDSFKFSGFVTTVNVGGTGGTIGGGGVNGHGQLQP